ncbi:SCAN domain-containing protein 3-like [Porites lutea]|uniref:SCAN domain-containing protein 3-like n=1 Tax=Porites lutea TaxID=51062 RepID=UPI003CC5AA7C
MEKKLASIYLDPSQPASFGGLDAVYRAVKEKGKNKISRKQVRDWLSQQDVYTLHKPARRRYKRSRVIVFGIDEQFQADLVDLQNLSRYNKGYKYLLTCIDIFSKYAFVLPLKTKQGQELVKAFQKILSTSRKPIKLQTDKGTEFKNLVFQKFLRDNNIAFFTVNSGLKASVVERFNGTFKNKMYKYFTAKNTLTYINVLPQLVSSYNNTYHRSIKMKPSQVTKANEAKVWDTLYGDDVQKPVRYKFQRMARQVPVYKLKDDAGEILDGTFYEPELQKIIKNDDVYRVEKILRKRKRKGVVEYLVRWKGYKDPKFDSWVQERDILKL